MSSRYFILCPLPYSSIVTILLTSSLSSSSMVPTVYPAPTIPCIKCILNLSHPNWTHSPPSFLFPNTVTCFFFFFNLFTGDIITWLILQITVLFAFFQPPRVITTHILLILSSDIFQIYLLLSLFTAKS